MQGCIGMYILNGYFHFPPLHSYSVNCLTCTQRTYPHPRPRAPMPPPQLWPRNHTLQPPPQGREAREHGRGHGLWSLPDLD